MRIKVVALDRADFEAWTEAQQQDAPTYAEDDTSEEAEGYRVFTGQLCASCHLIEGVNDDQFSDEEIPSSTATSWVDPARSPIRSSRPAGTRRTSPTS